MKTIIILSFVLVSFAGDLLAQNVAISDNAGMPHASAILDLQSKKKGVLVPRMKTADRLGIVAAAESLLVYDLQTESFWFRTLGQWKEISNSSQVKWKEVPGSSIYNLDSLPVIISNTGANVLKEGALIVAKDDTSSSGIVDVLSLQRGSTSASTDGIGGSIAFRNETSDNGDSLSARIFSQLTDAAPGTYKSAMGFTTYDQGGAENSMILSKDGLRIGSSTPANSMLDVDGNINTSGEVNRTISGDANMVPIAFGYVNTFGIKQNNNSTSNFTSVRRSTGRVEIRLTGVNVELDDVIISLTGRSLFPLIYTAYFADGSGTFDVNIFDLNGSRINAAFHMVVYLK